MASQFCLSSFYPFLVLIIIIITIIIIISLLSSCLPVFSSSSLLHYLSDRFINPSYHLFPSGT